MSYPYTPQSQSNSLLGVPSQILTFPTSQTSNNEDDIVTGDGLNNTQFSYQQTQWSSDSDRSGDVDIEIGARDSNRSLSTEIESDEEEEVIAEEGVDGTDANNAKLSSQQTQPSTSLDIEIGARDIDRPLSTEIESDEEEEGIATNYSVNDAREEPTNSDAEISDNFWQEVKVEGSFMSKDGRQYPVHLNWKFPKVQNVQFDPSYKHQCNICVLNSAMVQFPCYCILSLAEYAANEDRRFPNHHIKAVKKVTYPTNFIPDIF
jgi:hypothetical protein